MSIRKSTMQLYVISGLAVAAVGFIACSYFWAAYGDLFAYEVSRTIGKLWLLAILAVPGGLIFALFGGYMILMRNYEEE